MDSREVGRVGGEGGEGQEGRGSTIAQGGKDFLRVLCGCIGRDKKPDNSRLYPGSERTNLETNTETEASPLTTTPTGIESSTVDEHQPLLSDTDRTYRANGQRTEEHPIGTSNNADNRNKGKLTQTFQAAKDAIELTQPSSEGTNLTLSKPYEHAQTGSDGQPILGNVQFDNKDLATLVKKGKQLATDIIRGHQTDDTDLLKRDKQPIKNLTDKTKVLTPIVALEFFREDVERAKQLNVQPLTKGQGGFDDAIRSHVLVAVTDDGNFSIAPKRVQGKEISHAILGNEKSIVAVGEAKLFGSNGEYFLVDINPKSSCYQTGEHCSAICIEAFKHANIPLLDDALELLAQSKKQEKRMEQTPLPLSARSDTSSRKAERLWNALKGIEPDGRLRETSIRCIDKTGSYTRAQKARAEMTVELAAAISSSTQTIQDLFSMSIIPHNKRDVVYDTEMNRLCVPVGDSHAPLPMTVLSVIRQIDHAFYSWAGAREGEDREKDAQNAATMIRLIEACHKLRQCRASDLTGGDRLDKNPLEQKGKDDPHETSKDICECQKAFLSSRDTKMLGMSEANQASGNLITADSGHIT